MTDTPFIPKGITPTDEQLAIQLERRKHVIVEANAGAAKTTTLAMRLAQAIERGAHAENVLALTYTDAAVTALRGALGRIGVAAPVRNRIRIQTFDDFSAWRLASIEGPGVARYSTPEQLKPHVLQAIERVLSNADEKYADEFAIEGSGEALVGGFLSSFARLKGTMQLTLEAAERSMSPALADELGHDYTTLRVFKAYEQLRRRGHPEDRHAFRAPGDATYDLARMLLDDEGFVGDTHPLKLGLHLIAVDEMHDTNQAMFTVLKHLLLHNATAAFIGVGDRDQVIHSAAGADATFMGDTFDQEIGVAARFPLTLSYRFGQDLALPVGLLSKKPCSALSGRNTDVHMVSCADPAESNRYISDAIKTRAALGAKSGLAEVAILIRQPHQSLDLENHLLDRGVDYRTAGFDTYLMRPEVLFVRGLIAYARNEFAAIESRETRIRVLQALLLFGGSFVQSDAVEREDRVREQHSAVVEVASTPEMAGHFVANHVLRNAAPDARRLIDAAVEVIRQDATDILLQRFVQALTPHELAAKVLVRADDVDQVEANILGLIRSAATFDSVESFFRAMNEREIRQKAMRSKDCVVLASIEAVKGLEFEHVFLPQMNKGEFAVGGDTVNNRNLLYVGMTRAKNRLTILYDEAKPSKYLVDAGLLVPAAMPVQR